MSFKLIYKNIYNNVKEYGIYFFTLIILVSVFYVFNSIESHKLMMNYKFNSNQILLFVENYMEKVSIVVSIIIGLLFIYANNFLMKRRQREINIYGIIGMKNYQIWLIIFAETFIIGIISLIIGLIIGVFVSQGLSIITAKLFNTNIVKFKFILSSRALKSTLLCFGLIYFILFIFNSIIIRKTIVKHDFKEVSTKNLKLIFSLGLVLMLIFYKLIIMDKVLFNNQVIIAIVLGIFGTILFFTSLPGLFMRIILKKQSISYVIFKEYEKKANSSFMTLTCIFSTIAIIIFFTGTGISNAVLEEMKEVSHYDNFFWHPGDFDIEGYLGNMGVQLNDIVLSKASYKTYDSGFTYAYLLKENSIKDKKYHPVSLFYNKHFISGDTVPIMGVSDFNKLLEMNGMDTIEISEKEYVMVSDIRNSYGTNQSLLDNNTQFLINGIILSPHTNKLYNVITYNSLQRSNIVTLVVPDYLVLDMPVLNSFLNLEYKKNMTAVDEVFYKNITPHIRLSNTNLLFTTKEEVMLFEPTVRVVITYASTFIGIVFLLTQTAILSLKQMTSIVDSKRNINILKGLGLDLKSINRIILIRNLIDYIVPLGIAIIHSYFSIKAISSILACNIYTSMLSTNIFIFAMFLLFYGSYYLLTYLICKRILEED